jgi:hypothetical protein
MGRTRKSNGGGHECLIWVRGSHKNITGRRVGRIILDRNNIKVARM